MNLFSQEMICPIVCFSTPPQVPGMLRVLFSWCAAQNDSYTFWTWNSCPSPESSAKKKREEGKQPSHCSTPSPPLSNNRAQNDWLSMFKGLFTGYCCCCSSYCLPLLTWSYSNGFSPQIEFTFPSLRKTQSSLPL